jgi:hypothetical protein
MLKILNNTVSLLILKNRSVYKNLIAGSWGLSGFNKTFEK